MKRFTCLFVLCFPFLAMAQIYDNFADSNFSKSPKWYGDTLSFSINYNYQLQSNLTAAGTAYLALPNRVCNNTQWEFYSGMAFSPSSSNFQRIYLMSNQKNLTDTLRGYFLQLGEAGSQDAVDLFRQDGNKIVRIIHGRAATITKNLNAARIKVTRNDRGYWEVYSDTSGGSHFLKEGDVIDNTYKATSWFGVYTTLTSSNVKKVNWDDFQINPYTKDTASAELETAVLVDATTLRIQFSEIMDSLSACDISNYELLPNQIRPKKVIADSIDASVYHLVFANTFTSGQKNVLQIKYVSDKSGNSLKLPLTWEFTYTEYADQGIIINELLADPTPSVGLPEVEFIELLNNSIYSVPLKDWTISDVTTTTKISQDTLLPGEILILTSFANVALYQNYGKVVGLANWPSLNNDADQLILRNAKGEIIDKVSYNLKWYQDVAKAEGGWSLERINPNDFCHTFSNWKASIDKKGGTPGSRNSVFSDQKDTIAPQVLHLLIIDSANYLITFNEELDSVTAMKALFKLNGNSQADSIQLLNQKTQIKLFFSKGLIQENLQKLSIKGIQDCMGNISHDTDLIFNFFRTQTAHQFDVIITEIMADPDPVIDLPNAEYVELFNRSNKIINLQNWKLCNSSSCISLPNYFLLPDSFLIITSKTAATQFVKYGSVLAVSNMVSIGNDSEELYLVSSEGKNITYIHFDASWYKDYYKSRGGWSLEMMDVECPCTSKENWMASKDIKGGTPGKINSQNSTNNNISPPQILKLTFIDSLHIGLILNVNLDSSVLADAKHYSMDGNISISKVIPMAPAFSKVNLTFSVPLQSSKVYKLQVSGITNCKGQVNETKVLHFGIPQKADSADVIINEILFNPNSNGVDFIELYNRSEKIVDLKDLVIARMDDSNKVIDFTFASNESNFLLPNDFAVMTPNPEILQSQYFIPFPEKLFKAAIPPMNDDKGHVAILFRTTGKIIDAVKYDENWHFQYLKIKDGVSLEKINPIMPSLDAASWHSAASTVGFATPTYINSQYRNRIHSNHTGNVFLEKKTFSPDNDGFEDVLSISYQMANSDNVATVQIYNTQGQLVRNLLRNQLLASEGIIQWDGMDDNYQKASIGNYIILFNTYNPKGENKSIKLVCTLAKSF